MKQTLSSVLNNWNRFLAVLIFSLYLGTTLAQAQSVGTTTADILKINQGVRPAGMAGVYTAMGDDAYAIEYNPAGLAKIQASQLLLSHLDGLADISTEYLVFATAWGADNAVGVAFTYRYMPPIDNNNGNPAANAQDILGGATYARKVAENIRVGLSLKYLQSTLGPYTASSVMGDLGVQLDRLPLGIKAGLSLQNLGPGMTFNPTSAADPLPMFIRFGLGIHQVFDGQRDFNAGVEVFKPSDQDIKIGFGAEAWLFPNLFAIRGGYKYDNAGSSATPNAFNNYTLGCTLTREIDGDDFSLDIAYAPANFVDTSEDTFFFGLNLKFNQLRIL
jgi:hypothetical protein